LKAVKLAHVNYFLFKHWELPLAKDFIARLVFYDPFYYSHFHFNVPFFHILSKNVGRKVLETLFVLLDNFAAFLEFLFDIMSLSLLEETVSFSIEFLILRLVWRIYIWRVLLQKFWLRVVRISCSCSFIVTCNLTISIFISKEKSLRSDNLSCSVVCRWATLILTFLAHECRITIHYWRVSPSLSCLRLTFL